MLNTLNSLDSISSQFKTTMAQTQKDQQSSFSDIFKNMLNDVNKTDETVKRDQFLLATGQTDDLHTVTINMAKADVALQMFVQVRNKALEAYNDIMKMAL